MNDNIKKALILCSFEGFPDPEMGCEVEQRCPYYKHGCFTSLTDDAYHIIDGLEHMIVRCEDCKYGRIYITEDVSGDPLYECCHPSVENIVHPFDWFCADGERKE